MNEANLRSLWAKILRVSLYPPAMLAVACCESAMGTMPDQDTPDAALAWEDASYVPLCTNYSTIGPLGINPNQPADYVEFGTYIGYGPPLRRVWTAAGKECAAAANEADCKHSLATQLGTVCSTKTTDGSSCYFSYLATTNRDNVQVLDGTKAFTEFLAPIDTAQEALLVASWAGYSISCADKNLGDARPQSGGYEVFATRGSGCYDDKLRCVLQVSDSGAVTEQGCTVIMPRQQNCVIGRRPAGLSDAPTQAAASVLGRYFEDAARLEAAAVVAFRVLRDELRAHGAPTELRRLAQRAAREEIRHTRITAAIARRYAGRPTLPNVTRRPLRSLEEIAEENRVEGCVRETFGALVGCFQAVHARDAALRSVMREIAEDETRHAALSWQVAAWAEARLGQSARARILAAQQRAIQTLRAELHREPAPELVHWAGLPTANQAMELLDQVEQALWAQAG